MRRPFSEPASRDGIVVVMRSTWARTSSAETAPTTLSSDIPRCPPAFDLLHSGAKNHPSQHRAPRTLGAGSPAARDDERGVVHAGRAARAGTRRRLRPGDAADRAG